jgi:putative CocE/NonD family hydrolase
MVDRSAADQRADVAVFTSAPLTDDLWICGDLAAELHVDCDMRSHDLHCTLSMLPPGRPEALTLSSGCLRVPDAAAAGARHVPMRATAATLVAGARLRLSVQAAAYPAFAVNPGTGARAEDAHVADAQVTTLTIRHGVSHPSRLILPVAS